MNVLSDNIRRYPLEGASFTNMTSERELSPSDVVFHKIKEIVSDTPLWETILQRVNEEVMHSTEPLDMLMTSCAVNAYLLNMFLVGETQAKRVNDFLMISLCKNAPSTKYYHLLSGNALLDLKSKFQDPSFVYSKQNIALCLKELREYERCCNEFHNKVWDYYEAKMINPSFTDPSLYDFNKNVIDNLQSEINHNRNKVSKDCSFIYHVDITEPNPDNQGSANSIMEAPIGHFHAFVLEHYFDPAENTDMIRLHQSWKDQFSLSEHYQRHDFEGIIDGNQFCENLKGLFSYDASSACTKLRQYQHACFNVHEDINLAGIFRFNIGFFTGRSVGYLTSEINPQNCLKHIDDMLEKYGQ